MSFFLTKNFVVSEIMSIFAQDFPNGKFEHKDSKNN